MGSKGCCRVSGEVFGLVPVLRIGMQCSHSAVVWCVVRACDVPLGNMQGGLLRV